VSFKNDTFLKALYRENTPYTPIWIMRQAGRYLPEYRKARARAGSFLTLCKTPELACEVTLQPLQRFPLDAAILFSDILTIPDAMGLGLSFVEGEGPRFATRITDATQIKNLPIPDPNEALAYVMAAVRLIKQELAGSVPLIGFAGSPFTLAAYMVEGGSSKTFDNIKAMVQNAPEVLHALLTKLTEAVTLYLNAQIAAGVDVVMIFDSWGGLLDARQYQEFSLRAIDNVLTGLSKVHAGKKIPNIVFARGASSRLPQLKMLNSDALGLDEQTNLREAKDLLSSQFALQGNFAPALLKESDTLIQQEAVKILETMRGTPHVFNLGHGITPDIAPEKLGVLIEAVHNFK
jgi:uroporphyrinogen decarboxylase